MTPYQKKKKKSWGLMREWDEESDKVENLLVLVKKNRTAFPPLPQGSAGFAFLL